MPLPKPQTFSYRLDSHGSGQIIPFRVHFGAATQCGAERATSEVDGPEPSAAVALLGSFWGLSFLICTMESCQSLHTGLLRGLGGWELRSQDRAWRIAGAWGGVWSQ